MKVRQLQLPTLTLSSNFRACWLYSSNQTSWWLEWAKILMREKLASDGFNFEKITTNKAPQILAASLSNYSLLENPKSAVIYEYSGAIDATWAKDLAQLIGTLTSEQFLIVITNKLDTAQRKAKWYLALENLGPLLVVPIWNLEGAELISWLNLELRRYQLTFTKDAAQFLLQYTNGDPAAILQILMKLALLRRDKWTSETLKEFLEGGSFNFQALIYALLRRDAAKSLSLLDLAEAAGQEPLAILNSIIKELRLLIRLQLARLGGKTLVDALKINGVWFEHRDLVLSWQQADLAKLRQLLAEGEELTRVAKTGASSEVWQNLHWWGLKIINSAS